MTTTDVTVAVATCGLPETLARCLHALSRQTVPPAEVLVVDQAPSAAARAAAEATGLPGLRYLEQARLGLSASRNLALSLAGGAVMAVTDEDCVPDPGWVSGIAAALDRDPRPAAVSGPVLPLGEGRPGMSAISQRLSLVAADHRGTVLPWDAGSGGNFAGRVEILHRCGGWDERLGAGSGGQAGEDVDLLYRLLEAGETIRYEPEAVVRHEWKTAARRRATRWSYGYGIGAMCGLRLAGGDRRAGRVLAAYAGLNARRLLRALLRRDGRRAEEHARTLASLPPGLLYGVRAARRPSSGTAIDRGSTMRFSGR